MGYRLRQVISGPSKKLLEVLELDHAEALRVLGPVRR